MKDIKYMKNFYKLLLIIWTLFTTTILAAPSGNLSSVNLAWDYDFSINPSVTNIRAYYNINTNILNWNGTNIVSRYYTNNIDFGKTTNGTVSDLTRGSLYYFSVTAMSTNGLESDWSNEVKYDVPKKPIGPKNLTIQQTP